MSTFHDPLVARPLDVRDPRLALRALARLPYPFLLHSSLRDPRGRWSFFGADPFEVYRGGDWDAALAAWRARAAQRAGSDGHSHVRDRGDPGDRLQDGGLPRVPFTGGAVGYWSYDFGRRLERIPALAADDLGLPDFVLGLYDVVGAFDHASGEAWLFSSGLPLAGPEARRRAEARGEEFARRIEGARAPGRGAPAPEGNHAPGSREPAAAGSARLARSTFSPEGYCRAVEMVQDHIRRGDIFQANLSQRWTLPHPAGRPGDSRPGMEPRERTADGGLVAAASGGDAGLLGLALDVFDSLATVSPAPFAAFFGAGDHAIACASPERFLEVRGRRIEARPIKGTRPRGACAVEDETLGAELALSAKDRAENVMIVDVLRNDLGRVAETGSVAVPELCVLETFPQVFHLTSTVTGRLRDGLDAFDLLRAAFPGGSITGAPKIRAIEILERLEPTRRHIYTGSVGYVDFGGDADWNIAIRTVLVTRDALHFAAGGGITVESDPAAEYLETLHKAEGVRLGLVLTLGPVLLAPTPAVPA